MPDPVPPIRPEDIHPLTEFLRGHRRVVERLRESGRPEVLTVHGKAALVVQDARAYQRVLELADRMQRLLSVRAGVDSIGRGEGLSLAELGLGEAGERAGDGAAAAEEPKTDKLNEEG